jgi:integral membrane protein
MANWKSSVSRVRVVGMLEGISFLLLMGIAMPLKYLAEMPEAVRYTGWAHGLLFIAYCLVIFLAWSDGSLPFRKALMAFVASLLPFGPFLIDKRLELDEEREEGADGAI